MTRVRARRDCVRDLDATPIRPRSDKGLAATPARCRGPVRSAPGKVIRRPLPFLTARPRPLNDRTERRGIGQEVRDSQRGRKAGPWHQAGFESMALPKRRSSMQLIERFPRWSANKGHAFGRINQRATAAKDGGEAAVRSRHGRGPRVRPFGASATQAPDGRPRAGRPRARLGCTGQRRRRWRVPGRVEPERVRAHARCEATFVPAVAQTHSRLD